MALTSNSDIYGGFNESAFNTIIREVMEQRPQMFNYATENVVKFNSFCSPIKVNPILDSMGIQKSTVVPKMPIVGSTNSTEGIDFCIQLKEFKIDFQPSNQIILPVELGSLALQEFSLKGGVCAGINCGGFSPKKSIKDLKDLKKDKQIGLQFHPIEKLNMMCFCLDLIAKVVLVRENNFLVLKLAGIEIVDIAPLGLENSIECYLKQMLNEVVFPKMKIAIQDMVFNAGSYFSVGMTPISTNVPYNPNISNDKLSVFLNLN